MQVKDVIIIALAIIVIVESVGLAMLAQRSLEPQAPHIAIETITETVVVVKTETQTLVQKRFVGNPEYYSIYGGWLGYRVNGTGYFRIEKVGNAYWLVDPLGYLFISKGVNHVDYNGDYSPALGYSPYNRNIMSKYRTTDRWIEVTVSRLIRWGFNTVGSWSSKELQKYLPYTLILNILGGYGFDWASGRMPDVFAETYELYVDARAKQICSEYANDSLLLGYFIDNEPRWGPDWRTPNHLLDDFMKLPSTATGKRVAVDILSKVYGDISLLNREFGTEFKSFGELLEYSGPLPNTDRVREARLEFIRRYIDRYLGLAVQAIRRCDPNHLILGFRVAGPPKDIFAREAYKAASKYFDVFSINLYNFPRPPFDILEDLYKLTGKPIIITEFSFRARDSGLPNTKGAGLTVDTQQERANITKQFILDLIKMPFVVGYHWFQYFDQPKEGRFDGENSNYGIVNIEDEPYDEMVKMFTEVNFEVEKIRFELFRE